MRHNQSSIHKICTPAYVFLLIITTTSLSFISGCKEEADDFFEGRPSDIAMLHGKIGEGDPEALIELLRIPARFPDATESHIANWQGFIIVWWQYSDKRDQVIKSFGNLSSEETQALDSWILLKTKYLNKEKTLILDDIYNTLTGDRK